MKSKTGGTFLDGLNRYFKRQSREPRAGDSFPTMIRGCMFHELAPLSRTIEVEQGVLEGLGPGSHASDVRRIERWRSEKEDGSYCLAELLTYSRSDALASLPVVNYARSVLSFLGAAVVVEEADNSLGGHHCVWPKRSFGAEGEWCVEFRTREPSHCVWLVPRLGGDDALRAAVVLAREIGLDAFTRPSPRGR